MRLRDTLLNEMAALIDFPFARVLISRAARVSTSAAVVQLPATL